MIQDNIIRGIRQMMEDSKLAKAKRGGPMFFPHLIHELKMKYKTRIEDHETRYDSLTSEKYTKCISNATKYKDPGGSVLEYNPISGAVFRNSCIEQSLKGCGFQYHNT